MNDNEINLKPSFFLNKETREAMEDEELKPVLERKPGENEKKDPYNNSQINIKSVINKAKFLDIGDV